MVNILVVSGGGVAKDHGKIYMPPSFLPWSIAATCNKKLTCKKSASSTCNKSVIVTTCNIIATNLFSVFGCAVGAGYCYDER